MKKSEPILKAFIEFIQAENPDVKVSLEMAKHFMSLRLCLSGEDSSPPINRFQSEWMAFLRRLVSFSGRKIRIELPEWRSVAKGLDGELRDTIDRFFESVVSGKIYDMTDIAGKGYDTSEKIRIPSEDVEIPIEFADFVHLFSGFSLDEIKTCERCGKLFFNPHDSRRRFCSIPCQKNASMTRFREKRRAAGSPVD